MKRNYLISIFVLIIMALASLSACTSSADMGGPGAEPGFEDEAGKPNKKPGDFSDDNKKIRNELSVSGKISSIDAEKVTIEVYELNREKMEEMKERGPENDPTDPPKEGEAEKSRRKLEEMMIATGETKTYDISHAKLFAGERNKKDSEEEKTYTYADFSVGDMVTIVLKEDKETVEMMAKGNMRPGRQGFGKSSKESSEASTGEGND